MAYNLKQECCKPERLVGGHRLCAGCGASVAVRGVLRALNDEDKSVSGVATSCLEVSSVLYPFTAWNEGYIHSAFENVAATIAGCEAAYNAKKRKGEIKDTYKFIAFGGDGGTYDIGLQSLSGALERGHDMVYVCYDNEAYMNTGLQRSSSTPKFAEVSTAPVGTEVPGKMQHKKDLTEIVVGHGVPYVAQTTFTANFKDLHEKAYKAHYTKGCNFLNILAPCPRGWRYPPEDLMKITKLAVDTCVWPLYEVVEGEWKLTYEPKNKLPIEDYIKIQGRFRHLFSMPNGEEMIADLQAHVDMKWEKLLKKCK
ncbi:MAG: thiamine pyrophosphate-dependent enzyme [Defluviitaleaceae bacterium]|nr:thiamine pyrophosphate-dependent enzyme [Defluviitaleaceae bacterium]